MYVEAHNYFRHLTFADMSSRYLFWHRHETYIVPQVSVSHLIFYNFKKPEPIIDKQYHDNAGI